MFLVMGDCAIAVGRVVKDASFNIVGTDKKYHRAKFSLNVGKDMDLVSCTAWRSLASGCATLKKGEQVLVIGQVQNHEYNGKTYTDLTVEYAGITLARDPGVDVDGMVGGLVSKMKDAELPEDLF